MSDYEVNSKETVPPAPSPEELQRAIERGHYLRSEAFAYSFASLRSGLALLGSSIGDRLLSLYRSPGQSAR